MGGVQLSGLAEGLIPASFSRPKTIPLAADAPAREYGMN